MSLKSIFHVLLLSCILLLLWPYTASAEEQDDDKGKIDWKIDRISESDRSQNGMETELERSFPELFKAGTSEQIEMVQTDREQSTEQLKQNVFSLELTSDETLEETKELLFTEDYVAPKTSSHPIDQNTSSTSTMTIIWLMAVACALSGIAYLIFKRFADRGDVNEE